jgi:uncharacterized protein YodC (DUF2158 family)
VDFDDFLFTAFIAAIIAAVVGIHSCSGDDHDSNWVRQFNNGDWVTVKITGQHGMIVAYYHEEEKPESFTGSYNVRFDDYSVEKFVQYELKPYAPLPSPAPEPQPTATDSPISPEGAVFGERTWNPTTRQYE